MQAAPSAGVVAAERGRTAGRWAYVRQSETKSIDRASAAETEQQQFSPPQGLGQPPSHTTQEHRRGIDQPITAGPRTFLVKEKGTGFTFCKHGAPFSVLFIVARTPPPGAVLVLLGAVHQEGSTAGDGSLTPDEVCPHRVLQGCDQEAEFPTGCLSCHCYSVVLLCCVQQGELMLLNPRSNQVLVGQGAGWLMSLASHRPMFFLPWEDAYLSAGNMTLTGTDEHGAKLLPLHLGPPCFHWLAGGG